MTSSPPKFKKGDMVQILASGFHAWDLEMEGKIGTIVSEPKLRNHPQNPFYPQVWGYMTDIICPDAAPASVVEFCLRLIKDGDLKLDGEPNYKGMDLNKTNLEKVVRWLEESL